METLKDNGTACENVWRLAFGVSRLSRWLIGLLHCERRLPEFFLLQLSTTPPALKLRVTSLLLLVLERENFCLIKQYHTISHSKSPILSLFIKSFVIK